VERSADWLFQAEGDLEQARASLERGAYDWSSFASQQAAEMAVKAVFSRLGAEAWGHVVTELLQGLAHVVPVPAELSDAARELDKTYITARYPDSLPSGAPRSLYTRAEAERMVNHADAIVRFCSDYLAGLDQGGADRPTSEPGSGAEG
jgi:HEPN domain-containing protein